MNNAHALAIAVRMRRVPSGRFRYCLVALRFTEIVTHSDGHRVSAAVSSAQHPKKTAPIVAAIWRFYVKSRRSATNCRGALDGESDCCQAGDHPCLAPLALGLLVPTHPMRASVPDRVERGTLNVRQIEALLAPACNAAVICSAFSPSIVGRRPP